MLKPVFVGILGIFVFFTIVLFPTNIEAQYGPSEGSENFDTDNAVLEFSSSTIIVSSSTTKAIDLESIDSIFGEGDILEVSGKIKGVTGDSVIYSRISDPDNGFISQKKWDVSSDFTFNISHYLGGPFFADGIYNLDLAMIGANLNKNFWFDSIENDRKWTDFLIIDNYQYIQENCQTIDCGKIPRITSPPNTTFTWFNPYNQTSTLSIIDFSNSRYVHSYEDISSQDVFSFTFDLPGFYVYVVNSDEAFSNYGIQMVGIIHIDDEVDFSSGVGIVSLPSNSIEMEEFSSADLILSSSTEAYIKGDFAKVKVPPGTSVPGCETTLDCFTPSDLSVDKGATVMWLNYDNAAHTITGGSAPDGPSGVFDSSLFMAGTTYSHTFENPGTFEYFCMVHPWMNGRVTVLEPITNNSTNSLDTNIPYTDSESDSNIQTIEELVALSTLEINENPVSETTLSDIEQILVDWTNDQKTDSEFIEAIKLVIDENLISDSYEESQDLVPDWIKNDVIWWTEDLITDQEFLSSIDYLVEENILIVS